LIQRKKDSANHRDQFLTGNHGSPYHGGASRVKNENHDGENNNL